MNVGIDGAVPVVGILAFLAGYYCSSYTVSSISFLHKGLERFYHTGKASGIQTYLGFGYTN